MVQREREEGQICRLGRGLVELTNYLGRGNLKDGIIGGSLFRCLEVGPGQTTDTLEALSLLTSDGHPVYSPENLWAVDPFINLSKTLSTVPYLAGLKGRFTFKMWSAEETANAVARREIPPFDLVIAKGVVSHGGINYLGVSREALEEGLEAVFSVIRSMRRCLSDNPNAVMLLATTTFDSILPFREQELEKLGLSVVYAHTQTGKGAMLIREYQEAGIYVDTKKKEIIDLVICKKSDG